MKKFAILLICFAILCALCACGETEPVVSNEPTPPSEPVASAEPEVSGEPAVEASYAPDGWVPAVLFVPGALDSYTLSYEVADGVTARDAYTEFLLAETGQWHNIIRYVELIKLEQVHSVRVNGYTMRLYEYAYCLGPWDETVEPPAGWNEVAGEFYRDLDDTRYLVSYGRSHYDNAPLLSLTPEQFESEYGTDELVEKYGSAEDAALIVLCNERVGAASGSDGATGDGWWLDGTIRGDDGVEILDADGNDISETLANLWLHASAIYDVQGTDVFATGSEWGYGNYVVLDYDEKVDAIFSRNGRAQLESAESGGLPFYQFRDGKVWRREYFMGDMGIRAHGLLEDFRVVSVGENRIEMLVGYDDVVAGDETSNPEVEEVTERRYVEFTAVKTSNGWRVEHLPYPGVYVNEYTPKDGRYYIHSYNSLLLGGEYENGHNAEQTSYDPYTGELRMVNPGNIGGVFAERDAILTATLEDGVAYCTVTFGRTEGAGPQAVFSVLAETGGKVLESEFIAAGGETVELDEEMMIRVGRHYAAVTIECAENYIAAMDVLDSEEWQSRLADARRYREFNLELYDSDGRDISDEIIDLWIMGNTVYDGGAFECGDYEFEDLERRIYNFDEMADALYTDEGEAQLREAQFSTSGNFFFERDGSMWELTPGARMSWYTPDNIVGASFIEQTDTRIALGITYDTGAQRDEPSYNTVRFVVEKEGLVWKIADYEPTMAWFPSREATITVADGVEESAADEYMFGFAQDIARYASLDHEIEEYGCRIEEVVVEGIEEGPSMAVAEGGRYVLMRVLLRMKPDSLPDADLGEYIEVEDGWMTRDVEGDWYMAYYQSASGRWYAFSRTTDRDIDEYFGEAEDIAKHGDAYTAILNAYYKGSFDSILWQIAEAEPDAVELK